MRCAKVSFTFLLIAFFASLVQAGEARIVKVLPHYLDAKGRHSLSPSLYERDAYQAYLREHPEQRTALRFDVQWKGSAGRKENLKMKIEIRAAKEKAIEQFSLEEPVRKTGWLSNWSSLKLEGKKFRNAGQIIAWRATLWDGEKQLAEQKSFLW